MKDWYRFRGWDATGQRGWVYGDLVHNQKVTKEGLEPRTMVGGYEVVPESVGLFTGVHDRKGKDIYEGDILRLGAINFFVAYFCSGCGFRIQSLELSTSIPLDVGVAHDNIVIGNSFENKEIY